ncbi:MAG: recombinase family protein [Ignavibacteriales bacterium]
MQTEDTSKRALVYTRDACRSWSEGPGEQLRACSAYARKHGMTVVAHYDDHGSGLRAGKGLLALCANLEGADAIVIRDASRISRDPRLLLHVLSLAAKADVKVMSVEGGELNEENVFVRRCADAH